MEKKKHSYVCDRIAEALMQLLTEKPLIDITVTEIVKKADVGRASFYRNYSTTSDVLDYLVDETLLILHEFIDPIIDSDDPRIWRNFLFQYIYFLNNPDRKIFVIRAENAAIILNRLVNAVRKDYPDKENNSVREKYDFVSKISLINGVLLKWRETQMKETPEEIVDYLMDILERYHFPLQDCPDTCSV